MYFKSQGIRAVLMAVLLLVAAQSWAAGKVAIATMKNGSITSSVNGTTCTLTVTPNEGYYITIDDITVVKTINPSMGHRMVPAIPQPISLAGTDPSALGNERTYTFTMPSSEFDVYVTAEFKALNAINPTVSVAVWTYGQQASVPVVSGNLGNGAVTYEYKAAGADDFTSAVPTEAGSYVIRANVAANGVYAAASATATFNIDKATASISFSQTTVNKRYDDAPFTSVPQNTGDGVVTGYTSSDPSVATVDANGLVTILSYGSTTITATVADGSNYTYPVKTASYVLVSTFERKICFQESSDVEWITYVATENLSIPEGLDAYFVTGYSDEAVIAEEIAYIPENVPVLLHRASTSVNEYTAKIATLSTLPASNLLKVFDEAQHVDVASRYVLYNDEFVLVSEGDMPAGTVWLPLAESGNSARRRIQIGFSTGINALNVAEGEGKCYDLSGRRIVAPAKGVYIVNGKKIMVK